MQLIIKTYDAGVRFKIGDTIKVNFKPPKAKNKETIYKAIQGEILAIYPHHILIQVGQYKVSVSRFPIECENYRLIRRAVYDI